MEEEEDFRGRSSSRFCGEEVVDEGMSLSSFKNTGLYSSEFESEWESLLISSSLSKYGEAPPDEEELLDDEEETRNSGSS
ncbi:unnamed protein product [Orchesella dallaii]|uniref:Uncharacterized protein n=1 Tax=Orchesella dallaii TaxID=48710 RepID=A0ABP1PM27_9HEXA